MGLRAIFISIASYMDPLLLRTISSAIDRAADPTRLRFGVVDQSLTSQRENVSSYKTSVAYVHVHPRDSLGACWARSTAQTLYRGEEYFLQIDAHTLFEQDWDARLIAEHLRLVEEGRNPRVILSSFPTPFDLDAHGTPICEPHHVGSHTLISTDPVIDLTVGADGEGRVKPLQGTGPASGVLIAAGFLFANGTYAEEIPYDAQLYFTGEQLAIAVKAFTRGWDVWHPELLPAFHRYYSKKRQLFAIPHWSGPWGADRRWPVSYLAIRHNRRLQALLDGRIEGPFGLGTARSLDDFWPRIEASLR